MTSFNELGLSENLAKSLKEQKFETPTEIQEKAIPLIVDGKDIIGQSATGSGKTLAFSAGIIDRLEKGRQGQVLILTPTRELAEQVGRAFRAFSKYKNVHSAIIYGGVSISPQIHDLQRAEIVVGTPGRILDHLERGTLNLLNLKILILDEADRMLDMGFIEDVERIIKACPTPRQTLLFSATISPDIHHIAKKYMNHPVEVSSISYVDPSKLTQVYYDAPQNQKFSLLVHLLKNEQAGLVMVFCNTRRNTDFVANNLNNAGIDALAIHGGLTQNRRTNIMERFHSNKVTVLVCTDVAARGLDIPNVSHVYNYDLPNNSKEYIHRIGRTARAGSEGKAINIVSSRDYENFRNILHDNSLTITEEKMPEVADVQVRLFDRRDSRQSQRFSRRGPRSYGDRRFGDRRERSEFRGRSDRGREGYRPRRSNNRFGRSSSYR